MTRITRTTIKRLHVIASHHMIRFKSAQIEKKDLKQRKGGVAGIRWKKTKTH